MITDGDVIQTGPLVRGEHLADVGGRPAVDVTGQMIATTRGSNGILFGPDTYALFPLGGIGVCPTPPRAAGEDATGRPALLPDGQVVWRAPGAAGIAR